MPVSINGDGTITGVTITTTDLANSSVTTAKIADANVTGVKLETSGVTAGSYTYASVTVDNKGRVTAASSGASPSVPVDVQTFDSTGTWTKPSGGQTMARIQIWGGGGGGGNRTSTGNGAGGGGGGYNEAIVPISYLASSLTATVGSGGAARTVGGTSSVPLATAVNGRTTLQAFGGGPGNASAGAGTGGSALAAGTTVNNPTTAVEFIGGSATPFGIFSGGAGGGSSAACAPSTGFSVPYGGGGGGSSSSGYTTGGQSVYGGAGGAGSSSGNGSAGVQPGGGGGGALANNTGGSGAAGRVVITSW